MIPELLHAKSELGQAACSVLQRLEHVLTTAATLPMGQSASVSLHRVQNRTAEGYETSVVDAVMLEPQDPARATRALLRAAVSELAGRAAKLPPDAPGIVTGVTGHYFVRPSSRKTIIFSFTLQTTRQGLTLFREEARADVERRREADARVVQRAGREAASNERAAQRRKARRKSLSESEAEVSSPKSEVEASAHREDRGP